MKSEDHPSIPRQHPLHSISPLFPRASASPALKLRFPHRLPPQSVDRSPSVHACLLYIVDSTAYASRPDPRLHLSASPEPPSFRERFPRSEGARRRGGRRRACTVREKEGKEGRGILQQHPASYLPRLPSLEQPAATPSASHRLLKLDPSHEIVLRGRRQSKLRRFAVNG